MKKFNKIIACAMMALVGLSFTACSDDALDTNPYNKSGVNLLAFGPCPMERTHEIRITGTNMNAVDKVVFPHDATVSEAAVERSAFNNADAENIYVNIPDATVPGPIKLVAKGDTITSTGIITFDEPIEITSVTPETGINPGDIITISGDYVYNIASVTFTSGVVVTAEEFISTSRREIKVQVPLSAESGVITLSDGADWSLDWKNPLEILSAKITSVTPNSADFGNEITIKGTNLHTVETLMFAGGVQSEFTLVDNQTIKTTVPAECKSGAITLLLFSGNTVTSEEFSVPTISISGINQSEDIIPGDVITITGENFDRIKTVTLPGAGNITDYKVEGNTLTFTVPDGFVDGDIVLTQNSNISASISVKIRKMAGIVWMGNVECTAAWSGSLGVFNWEPYFADFQAAMSGPGIMTLGIEVTGNDPMIKIAGSDWNSPVFENVPEDCVLHPAADAKEVTIEVTAADLARAFPGGFVIYGCNYKLKYVKYVVTGAEQVLWEGTFDEPNWTNWEVGKGTHGDGNPNMFSEAGIKEGQILRVYVEPKDENWWQIQFFDGHWGGLTETGSDTGADNGNNVNPNVYTLGDDKCIKFELSKSTVEKLTTLNDWGAAWIIQCENMIVKKITVANN